MNLIEAFENNKVEGVDAQPDSEIESVISRLFFYGDKVCKIYKYDKTFFGDFSASDFRDSFYKEDFYWNHKMSPRIYLELKGVRRSEDGYVHVDLDVAEDFYIVMQKIDDSKNLLNLLIDHPEEVTEQNLIDIVHVLTSRLRELTKEKRGSLKHFFDKAWPELQKEDFEDLRNWAYMAEEHVPKAKTDEIIERLITASQGDPYLQNYDQSRMSATTDNHGGNILIIDNEIGFIDILAPKENWRVADEIFSISRPATDVAVLWGKDKADLMYETYREIAKPFPESIRTICDIRSALIMAPYLHMLHKHHVAEKYMNFIEEQVELLGK